MMRTFCLSVLCFPFSALAFSPSLTPIEQANCISLHEANFGAKATGTGRDATLSTCKNLLQELDRLPGSFGRTREVGEVTAGDGTRKGNALYKRLLGELLYSAKQGVDRERFVDEILKGSPNLILRRQSLLTDIKGSKALGLDTPENLERLKRGRSPFVTKGNPKYLGQRADTDHVVPCGKYPQYENELGNFRMLPQSLNSSKGDTLSTSDKQHLTKLQRVSLMEVGINGAANFGFGASMFYSEAPLAFNAWQSILSGEESSRNKTLTAVRHSSFGLSGLGGVMEGGAKMGDFVEKMAETSKAVKFFAYGANQAAALKGAAVLGRRLGTLGFAVGEVCLIAEWQSGTVNNQEFVASQAAMAGGLAGAWVGAKAGAAAGASVGVWLDGVGAIPIGAIGAVAGSVSGAFAGSALAGYAVRSAFNRLDGMQKLEVAEHIRQQYPKYN